MQKTINSIDPDTAYVTITDENGNSQTIVSDSRHPYFANYGNDATPPTPPPEKDYLGDIENAYWINAGDLEVGHKVLDDDGSWQTITALRVEQKPLNSYNLEVNVDHTFFIRGIGGLDGIWVHNKDCWHALPVDATATGKTTPDGRKLYTFKDESGNQVTVYKGSDGRWYNPKAYKPDDVKAQQGAKSVKTNSLDDSRPVVTIRGTARNQYTQKQAIENGKKFGYEEKEKDGVTHLYKKNANPEYLLKSTTGHVRGEMYKGFNDFKKMIKSSKRKSSKDTDRTGTYDKDLNRINK